MATPTTDGVFTTSKRRTKPITFSLDGEVYEFTPPKRAGAFLRIVLDEDRTESDNIANARATLDWLHNGLPEDQSARIIERLKDPEDDLDIDGLTKIIRWLEERVAGRPTG